MLWFRRRRVSRCYRLFGFRRNIRRRWQKLHRNFGTVKERQCFSVWDEITSNRLSALNQFQDSKEALFSFRLDLEQDVINAEDKEDLVSAFSKAESSFFEITNSVVGDLSYSQVRAKSFGDEIRQGVELQESLLCEATLNNFFLSQPLIEVLISIIRRQNSLILENTGTETLKDLETEFFASSIFYYLVNCDYFESINELNYANINAADVFPACERLKEIFLN